MYIVYDPEGYECFGPFDSESDAKNWIDKYSDWLNNENNDDGYESNAGDWFKDDANVFKLTIPGNPEEMEVNKLNVQIQDLEKKKAELQKGKMPFEQNTLIAKRSVQR